MKLFNAQQLQQWDAYTVQEEQIASINLMERAATQCTAWLIERELDKRNIRIFCGKGNNGGDGLAIARLLINAGAAVTVYIVEFGAKGTSDFQHNLERLHLVTRDIHFIQSPVFFPYIDETDLVIDALLGSGLNRPLHDLSAALVTHINAANTQVISIDLPSGMPADLFFKEAVVVKATHTLTFQAFKFCFVLPEYAIFTGQLHILDIGLNKAFPDRMDTIYEMAEREELRGYLKTRAPFSHKGIFGHALLMAGHEGQMGAAILASKACLRAGVGKLTVLVPNEQLPVIQTAIPEAMAMPRERGMPQLNGFAVVAMGPGMSFTEETAVYIEALLNLYEKPMVLDADAFAYFQIQKDALSRIPAGSLLTPHPKEFDLLFGASENSFERYRKALALSGEYPFIIILKGHYTLIASNGKGWFNTTGNAGMAKGGSGDVLTGILTAYRSMYNCRIQKTDQWLQCFKSVDDFLCQVFMGKVGISKRNSGYPTGKLDVLNCRIVFVVPFWFTYQ